MAKILFFSLFLFEVIVPSFQFEQKARAVLVSCDNPHKTLKSLDKCKRRIDLLIESTSHRKTGETQYVRVNMVRDKSSSEDFILLHPLIIQLKRKHPKLVYPLKFLKTVNNKAYEVFFHKENTVDYEGCKESLIKKICGTSNDKQGFCCPCGDDYNEKIPYHIRSGQDCTNKWTSVNKAITYHSSAHCLKFDPVWYTVNELKAPVVEAEVFVDIFQSTGNTKRMSPVTKNGELHMGIINSSNHMLAKDGKVLVSMVRSTSPKIDPLKSQQNRLLIPQKDPLLKVDPLQLQGNASEFLVVDKKLIGLDGNVCDKIGVSYEGFVSQKNRCDKKAQSCLQNQPMHFWLHDVERQLQGRPTKYFLSGFSHTDHPELVQRSSNLLLSLNSHLTNSFNMLIQINADKLQLERKGNKAEILDVQYGMDNPEDLSVNLYNPDLLSQVFTVHLHSCNTSIVQSYRKRVHVPAHQSRQIYFIPKAENTKYPIHCIVSVVNHQQQNKTGRRFWYTEGQKCICPYLLECRCEKHGHQTLYKLQSSRVNSNSTSNEQSQRSGVFSGPSDPTFLISSILLLVLNIGFMKATLGILFPIKVGQCCLCLFVRGKVLTTYFEKDLKGMFIAFNEKGLPVHPRTKKPVQMMPSWQLFLMNLFIVVYLPLFPFHLLYRRLRCKDVKSQIKQEESFWKHKLNSSASEGLIQNVEQNKLVSECLQMSPSSLAKMDKDLAIEHYRKQKRELMRDQSTSPGNSFLGSDESDNESPTDNHPSNRHAGESQVNNKPPISLSRETTMTNEPTNHLAGESSINNQPSNHQIDESQINKQPSNHQIDESQINKQPSNHQIDESQINKQPSNHQIDESQIINQPSTHLAVHPINKEERKMTKIKAIPGRKPKSKMFSQKHSLQSLLQTEPVYCNFENMPTSFLQNAGDCYSLCGLLSKEGRKYKFHLGAYHTQTCQYVGNEVHRLAEPHRILHPQQFTVTMTASDMYRMITVEPMYPCLNALLRPFNM